MKYQVPLSQDVNRRLRLLVLLLVFTLAGCGGGGGGGGGGPDVTPPVVSSQTLMPGDGATGVAVNSAISVTFNESMDPSTINTDTFIVSFNPIIEGTVSYDMETKTANFSPSSDLEAETTYTVTITTGVTDLAGNALEEDRVWTFTTGSSMDTLPPTVQSTAPANNETEVMVNTVISATFSEEMDPSTINSTTFLLKDENETSVSGTVTYMAVNAIFIPSSDLEFDMTYTATITTDATDLSSNALQQDEVWSFTTGIASDTTPPTVDSTTPTNGATGIQIYDAITATFSEAMNATTIDNTSFLVEDSVNNPVNGNITYNGNTATFTPTDILDTSETYTATITTDAQDLSGNGLVMDHAWSFTTDSVVKVSITGPAAGCETAYSPDQVTIKAGMTVEWTNNVGSTHTVTSSNATLSQINQCVPGGDPDFAFNSGSITSGNTFSRAFNMTGEFVYDCTISGHQMRGAVIVQ